MLHRLGPKRVALLLCGIAYLGLFVDAYIGHVATGGGISVGTQYIPLVLAPVSFGVLAAVALARGSDRTLGRVTLPVGALSMVTGLAGVGFHVAPILEDLGDEELTFGSLTGALGSGPPLLAPAAFFALGVLIIALGRPRVRISIDPAQGEGTASDRAAARPGATASADHHSAHRAA